MRGREIRNSEQELHQFQLRVGIAGAVVLAAFALLAARFLWLQVLQHDVYQAKAEDNRISIVPVTPNRGLIVDRNGVVIARNYSGYTLEIFPRRVKNIERTIDAVSEFVDVTPRDRVRFRKLLQETRNAESLPIKNRLSDEEVAKFAANRYRFEGVEIKARLFRQYPLGDVGSHVLGYLGRINTQDQQKLEDDGVGPNYRGTDYIGKAGIEATYESELHGATGFEQVEIDAAGRGIRTLSRTPSQPGNNVTLTLDMRLQQVAEIGFGDRRGALVALDPNTGGVLALVSKPGFDPNMFVDGIDPQYWAELQGSLDKPLNNRAISGLYPPGSTIKPYLALAALETGKRRTSSSIFDPGYFDFGGRRFRDDKKGGHGVVDMYKSIVESCDTYYYHLANDLGIDAIARFLGPFGFGSRSGIDLAGEFAGVLPSPEWKIKRFKQPAQQKWFPGETISIGIGQGYHSYTPLQLAQATAMLATGGTMYKPRLLDHIDNPRSGDRRQVPSEVLHTIALRRDNVDFIKRSMAGVSKEGTAARAFAGVTYTVGGKTGTAQVIAIKQNEKYEEAKVAERHRDHSLFVAFAPVESPRIALAIIVENGGFGARAAAPLARTVLDYFMLGKLPAGMDQPTPEDEGAADEESESD
ncbi:MAG: penicillin-binding protein 2 [Betaproteobacteria bacterium]|nr:penicillin-binding protein 2 [Betaproteobacteria bacterium]